MTHHVEATDTGHLAVTLDNQPITPAEARRLAKDLCVQAGVAEHTVRCKRDGERR